MPQRLAELTRYQGNMKRALSFVASLALLSSAFAAPRQVLMPGDPAPDLSVSQWIKGEPISRFQKGQVYVVEMWATWCGPCRRSVPHLTSLQKKHGSDVTIIGISVKEVGDDIVAGVRAFVEQMGDRMEYHVAMDSADKGTERHWMAAALRRGIPAAFIVDQEGKIAWIGHPLQMDAPLAQVIKGTFNVMEARGRFQTEVEEIIRQEEAQAMIATALEIAGNGQIPDALNLLDAVYRELPVLGRDVFRGKAQVLAEDEAGIRDLIRQAEPMLGDEMGETLANCALLITERKRKAELDPKVIRSARLLAEAAMQAMSKEMEVPIRYYLGLLALNLEEYGEAASHFEAILRVTPENEETKGFRAEIQKLLNRARKG
jgi:thiol-disulfide isomerase/thioredoxin